MNPATDSKGTVTEEQLVLFNNHIELQKAELSEQSEKNRAEEAIEMRRITAEEKMHGSNLAHAERVIEAQVRDRGEIRTFWSTQLNRVCTIAIVIAVVGGLICGIAIYMGATEAVFDSIKTLGTHALALLAGLGADRAWVHRKKAGISSPVEGD